MRVFFWWLALGPGGGGGGGVRFTLRPLGPLHPVSDTLTS